MVDKEYTPAEAKAWLNGYDEGKKFTSKDWKYNPMTGEPLVDGWPLYSGLPKKEWEEMTEEDIKNIEGWIKFKEGGSIDPVPLGKLVLYISHKIREKNHA